MTLTAQQEEILQTVIILLIFNVGLIYTLKAIIRKINGILRKAKIWFIKRRNKHSKIKGYKNYKGDTWFPDGTYYNSEKKKFETPDYRNK